MVFVDNQVSVVLCSAAAVCEVLSPVGSPQQLQLYLCWVISYAFHLFFAEIVENGI